MISSCRRTCALSHQGCNVSPSNSSVRPTKCCGPASLRTPEELCPFDPMAPTLLRLRSPSGRITRRCSATSSRCLSRLPRIQIFPLSPNNPTSRLTSLCARTVILLSSLRPIRRRPRLLAKGTRKRPGPCPPAATLRTPRGSPCVSPSTYGVAPSPRRERGADEGAMCAGSAWDLIRLTSVRSFSDRPLRPPA